MVTVMAPATSANLGPGFDFLGLALELYNFVHFTPANEWTVTAEGYGAEQLVGRKDLLVCQAIERVYAESGHPFRGGKVHLENRIPEVGGLGSSASAIVGGLVAANSYLGEPFSKEQLLVLATEIEGHPDNVAPAIFGGLVGVLPESATGRHTVLEIPFPEELHVVLGIPQLRVATKEARQLLPAQVTMEEAIFNLAHTGVLVGACFSNRTELLRLAMRDKLHQDRRSVLIPGFHSVLAEAYRQGAMGVALSGSGPTIIAFCPSERQQAVGEGMVAAFAAHNLKAQWLSVAVNREGYRVL
ncbi:MAG: homoserine kinase [Firmicutes bacterium]|nr:homoserine kinase [Bacillota bacterium]